MGQNLHENMEGFHRAGHIYNSIKWLAYDIKESMKENFVVSIFWVLLLYAYVSPTSVLKD